MRAKDLVVGQEYRGVRGWQGFMGARIRCIAAPAKTYGDRLDGGRFEILDGDRKGEVVKLEAKYVRSSELP
jgi:hypothetical protein